MIPINPMIFTAPDAAITDAPQCVRAFQRKTPERAQEAGGE